MTTESRVYTSATADRNVEMNSAVSRSADEIFIPVVKTRSNIGLVHVFQLFPFIYLLIKNG